jgi:hypothetical protein
MTEEKEAFLDRWSRLKQEQPREQPAELPVVQEAKQEVAVPLPRVEDLKPDSDFVPFMQANVDPATRRSALKKLFADPHYSIPDPFEAYCEDYTQSEPIPAQMLKAINRARDLAVDGPEKVAEADRLEEEARDVQPLQAVPPEAGKTAAAPAEAPELPNQEAKDAGKQDA